MGQPSRLNSSNTFAGYTKVLYINGRAAMDFSMNEMQDIRERLNRGLTEQIIYSGAVVQPDPFTVNTISNSSGTVTVNFNDTLVFWQGNMFPVTGGTFVLDPEDTQIFLKTTYEHITTAQDDTLIDPNNGSPIDERFKWTVAFEVENPDVLDEPFNVYTQGLPPFNTPYNVGLATAWTNVSNAAGVNASGFARWPHNDVGLLMTNTEGIDTSIEIQLNVVPSQTYTVQWWAKTYYGSQDVALADGVNVSISDAVEGTPYSVNFATVGGLSLLQDFTLNSFTFTASSSTPFIKITMPASMSYTTTIAISSLLVTTSPIDNVLAVDRHFTPIFNVTRSPLACTPVIPYKCVFTFADLSGSLPWSRITGVPPATGDIQGTYPGPMSVIKINGMPVIAGTPSAGQFLVEAPGATGWEPASISGDVAASATTPGKLTVTGIQNFPVSSATPGTGNLLEWNGTAWTPTAAGSVTVPYVSWSWDNLIGNTASSTNFNITADRVLAGVAGGTTNFLVTSFSGAVNISTAGPIVNGRDQSGAFTASSFIHIYAIAGVAGHGLIASNNAPPTGPNLPSGYTGWAYATTLLLDGSTHITNAFLRGRKAFYQTEIQVLTSGANTSPTPQSVSSCVPAIAQSYDIDASAWSSSEGLIITFQLTSGDNYYSGLGLSAGATAFQSFLNLPNVGQNFYWLTAGVTGVGAGLNVQVMAFEVPNHA